jgi:hypothetical protein
MSGASCACFIEIQQLTNVVTWQDFGGDVGQVTELWLYRADKFR